MRRRARNAALTVAAGIVLTLSSCATDTQTNDATSSASSLSAEPAPVEELTASETPAADPTPIDASNNLMACAAVTSWLTDASAVVYPENPILEQDPKQYAKQVRALARAGDRLAEDYASKTHLVGPLYGVTMALDRLAEMADAGYDAMTLITEGVHVNAAEMTLITACSASLAG
jgi:hypothetical protein